jgi:quercetin dioxygenase-like cupin family protein
MSGYVVSAAEVPATRADGDTAQTRVTIDGSVGCERLEQRVISFGPGRSAPRRLDDRQEILYVAAGRGVLHLGGEAHELEPDSGAFLCPGESYEIEVAGPEPLEVVSVLTVAEAAAAEHRTRVIVRFADQEELVADADRSFRYLVNEDAGCGDVTQFIGLVKPCRAPDHSHPYDEVGYIAEGNGLAHVAGEVKPIGPGSCFHLPPGSIHCIENTGPGVMRLMGVFHPSGSPKQRSYDAGSA